MQVLVRFGGGRLYGMDVGTLSGDFTEGDGAILVCIIDANFADAATTGSTIMDVVSVDGTVVVTGVGVTGRGSSTVGESQVVMTV